MEILRLKKRKIRLIVISKIFFLLIIFSCTKNEKKEFSNRNVINKTFEDKKDSSFISNYYKDGALKSTENIINSFDYVEVISYHKDLYEEFLDESDDGDTIFVERPLQKSYEIVNKNDSVVFQVNYDSVGNVVKINGKPIYIFQKIEYQNEIEFQFCTVRPNWVNVIINYTLFSKDQNEMYKKGSLTVKEIFFIINFGKLKNGNYKLNLEIELNDKYKQNIFDDTLGVDFEYNFALRDL
jgi:hypothetical protein